MKKIKFVSPFFTLGMRSMLFIASLFIATTTHAGIMNADFSQGVDGLDSWLGDIVIDTGVGNDFNSGDITSDYPGLFSTDGLGSATIVTGDVLAVAPAAAGEAYIVTLFQEFVLDPIAVGSSLFLSVDLSAIADDFFAEFINLDTSAVISLTSGNKVDISSWVGANVSLEFIVEDFGGSGNLLGDSLTISNILFEERLSVPEPPLIFAVLVIALILIRHPRLTK